ncbi:MAG TPA: SusC/RagA family TonB-linked outer membrane protein [Chryseolinea sp.]
MKTSTERIERILGPRYLSKGKASVHSFSPGDKNPERHLPIPTKNLSPDFYFLAYEKIVYSKFKMLAFVLCLLISTASVAQEIAVSGTVTSEESGTLPGVNVFEKGTFKGTVSDEAGRYSITVSSNDAILVFSFVGYQTIEVPVNGRTVIDVLLPTDVTSLQEIVVTGYNSNRKADIVGAISQINAASTVAIIQGDVSQALQGRVAGVQVSTSGQPGAGSQTRIRGFGSLTNNNPLYVIDGVPTFDNTQINALNVESQVVLKDAGAASIYGARAAGGVIVITTKHGKYNAKPTANLDFTTGVTLPGNGPQNLNPQQQADKVYEALRNSGAQNANGQPYGPDLNHPVLPDYILVGVPGQANTGNVMEGDPRIATALAHYNIDPNKGQLIQVAAANKAGTNWYKEMTRPAPTTRLSLSLSGGTERSHYYTNFTYLNQQGIVVNQYLKRFSLRFNTEFKPMKNVRIGENMLLTYRSNPFIYGNSGQQGANNGSGSTLDENALNLAYRMPTIIPVHDAMGNWAGTQAPGFNNPSNPVAAQTRLNDDYNRNVINRVFGNAFIEVDPVKHVMLRSNFGGAIDNTRSFVLSQRTYENAVNTTATKLSESSGYQLSFTFTNTIQYDNKFGNHSLKAIVGHEAIKSGIGRTMQGIGFNPYSIDPNYIDLTNTSASTHQLYSNPYPQYTFLSLFGKVDYNWKEKYYLSATLRRDGSSLFGPQNRYGVFPAVSGAWRMSAEKFMSGVTFIQDLKLRGGYGTLGSSNAILISNPSNQFSLYQRNPATGYDIGGTNGSGNASGFAPLQIGNPTAQWETSATGNIGLDGTLLNGTLEVIFEVWTRKTSKLLYNPAFLNTGGVYPNNPFQNVGSMTNQGIDLQVIKKLAINTDWSITLDGNISPFKNKITAIAPGQTYFEPSGALIRNLQLVRNAVGHPISSFYGYQVVGYFKDAEDVASSPTQNGAAPGRFKYADTDRSGTVGPEDRVFLGSPIPKFTYGININVRYKNFQLTGFLYGSYGNKIMNFSKWYTDFYSTSSGAALSKNTLQSFSLEPGADNSNAKTPVLESAANFSTSTQSNSWYMESGSYARLKNLQLSYDLPATAVSKAGLSHVKVWVQAVNLFTITKYTGMDPELVGYVDTIRGVDVGNYPATKQYFIGFNIEF